MCVALYAWRHRLKEEGSTVFEKYTVQMHVFSTTEVDLKRSAPGKEASEAWGMDLWMRVPVQELMSSMTSGTMPSLDQVPHLENGAAITGTSQFIHC